MLNFLKKTGVAQPTASEATKAKIATQTDDQIKVKPATSGLKFLKTGAAAKQAFAAEEARAAAQQAEADKMWRFWLQPDEDAKITFLDGELDEEGMLDITTFYEHFMLISGKPRNFICTDDTEACPICERGDSQKNFVGVMTIIDHRKHTIKNGPNTGKFIINDRKLFVAKRGTLKMLTKIAAKRDGLAGCMFDVSRGNDKTPNVGNNFDFSKKFESFNEIADTFKLELEDVSPADYGEELTYYTAEELIALGVGKAISGPGYGKTISGTFGKKVSGKAMADKL